MAPESTDVIVVMVTDAVVWDTGLGFDGEVLPVGCIQKVILSYTLLLCRVIIATDFFFKQNKSI